MRTYIYTMQQMNRKDNIRLTVYHIKRNQPVFIGCGDYSSAAYKGDLASVKNIISDIDGIKMRDGYNFVKENNISIYLV